MKLKKLMTINAFVFIGAGIAFALYSPLMIDLYGILEFEGDIGWLYWYAASFGRMFGVMLFGTGFSLMAPLAYYVLLGFGKAVSIFFTSAIRALCNLLLVSIVVVVSGTLTVEQVSFCVLLSWVLSTLFIAYRARCVLSAFALATQSRGNGDEKRNMLGSTWIRRSVN